MALFAHMHQIFSAKTVQRFCVSSLFAFSAVCGPALLTTDASAGFQWVSPIEKAPTPIVPAPAPVSGADMPAPMQLPGAPEVAPPSAVVAPPVQAAAPAPSPATELVEGFGRDIPLNVALKQILPSSYGFALDGVDAGMLVSWEGGKAWYHVLDDMLTKAKLYGREEGQIIKISPAKLHDAAPADQKAETPAPAAVAANDPPLIVPPMPVLENAPVVQPIESTPPAAAKGIEPLVILPTGQAAVEPALPPIPQGELVAPNATMMPQLQPTAAEMWRAEPGDHLHAVIKKWCARANVELVWSTEYDYPVQASVNFSGSFEDAVRGLLIGFVEAKPQPYGRLHDNPSVGQRTLVIEARGNTNSD